MCVAMSVFDIEYTAVPWEWEDITQLQGDEKYDIACAPDMWCGLPDHKEWLLSLNAQKR